MKQTTKNILGVAAIVLLSSGVAGITTYKLMQKAEYANQSFDQMFEPNPGVNLAAFSGAAAQPVDLTQAAENSVHGVVHIRSTQSSKVQEVEVRDPFYDSLVISLAGVVVRKNVRYRLPNVQASARVSSFRRTDIS